MDMAIYFDARNLQCVQHHLSKSINLFGLVTLSKLLTDSAYVNSQVSVCFIWIESLQIHLILTEVFASSGPQNVEAELCDVITR